MKIFDVDWAELLAFSGTWSGLSIPQRAASIELGTGDADDVARFGEHLDVLLEIGVLELFKGGERARPTVAIRPVLKVLRLMNRAPVLRDPSDEVLEAYFAAILTNEERAALSNDAPWSFKHHFHGVVSSRAHLDGFLASDDVAAWERERLPEDVLRTHFTGTEAVLADPRAAKDLKRLLERLAERPEPVPLGELPALVGRMSRRRLADAIRAGLRYALCVAGFDERAEPALGLHPEVHTRLHRVPAPAPQVVEPDSSSCSAWMLEDVIQLVVYCSEPRRVKAADSNLFAKAEAELTALLRPGPEGVFDEDAPLRRTRHARRQAAHHGYVETVERGGKRYLEVTEEGRAWLILPAPERARCFLEPMRLAECASALELPWLEFSADDDPVQAGLLAAFAELEGPVLLEPFLAYHAQSANPLLRPDVQPGRHPFSQPRSDEACEQAWSNQLALILEEVLLPHGGIRIGRLGEEVTIELTEVGRYLLGLAEELDWPDTEPQAAVVVQPDFEIVFLAPSPALEARLTPFAERIGQGLGALFRLTRASVQAAIDAGTTLPAILETLSDLSQAQLPDNVRSEVTTWCEDCLHLAWEPAHLIRCPDEETAARVLAASKGKLEALSPTVLALVAGAKLTAITGTCRKAGVFLKVPEDEGGKKKKRKRRRRNHWRRRW